MQTEGDLLSERTRRPTLDVNQVLVNEYAAGQGISVRIEISSYESV